MSNYQLVSLTHHSSLMTHHFFFRIAEAKEGMTGEMVVRENANSIS
jgi:hypothetical protein